VLARPGRQRLRDRNVRHRRPHRRLLRSVFRWFGIDVSSAGDGVASVVDWTAAE
jgi:hypothetical protein